MWRIGLAFLLGHCCAHLLPVLPSWRWLGGVLLVTVACACVGRLRLCSALLAGFAWACLNAGWRIAADLPPALEGEDLLVRGYVASLPQRHVADPQFLLDTVEAPHGVPPRVRLAWYRSSQAPQAGELWQLVVRLKRRNGLANPGGGDYEGQLFRAGIGAIGYVREDERNRRLAAPSPKYAVARMRSWIALRIDQAVRDQRMLGVLQGLAVGDTQAMTAEQWRVFAATGTTHLMAISGLHISMIAALAAWLGGAIVRLRWAQGRCWNAMHGQVLAGVSAAAMYSSVAGLSIPTQRTLLMLCIYFAARWCRRDLPVMHAFGLALIGVLLIDPFAPLAPGAWLSFGAVAIILMTVSGRIRRQGPVGSFLRVQGAITIGLTPFLLAAFGGVSMISPVANAVAIPLFTLLIVPTVLLGALAAVIWLPAGEWILRIPVTLLEHSWPVLQWLAQQPSALWYFPQVSAPVLVAGIAGVLLFLLPGIWPTRFAGALLCLPLVFNQPARPAVGDFELAVLDVGQGLAAVVRTHSHSLVYDVGPAFRSGRDAAELAVLPYLRHRGVRRLDMLVVSHGDLDHRGGMNTLLGAMPVARVLAGQSVAELPLQAQRCEHGQSWTWDAVRFRVLHPEHGASASDNDSSCVLRVEAGGHSVLLAGDIEAAAEREITDRGLPRSDVVIVPHHGSRTSSTGPFVAASRPALALVSVGYRNRWQLPRADVVERWHAAGARLLTTADSGAIEISFTAAQSPLVQEYRRNARRYWHR